MKPPILTIKIFDDIAKKHLITVNINGKINVQETIYELELYRCIREALKIRLAKNHNKIMEQMKNFKG